MKKTNKNAYPAENTMQTNRQPDTKTREIPDDNAIVFAEKKRSLFLGLPWTFTKYIITPDFVTIKQGVFTKTEDDCYMYKIQDVKLTSTVSERMLGLSTLICYTGDITHPQLQLVHIKHASEIKAYLLSASETARLKRRTLNTMDIGAHSIDFDGGDGTF